MKKSILSAAIFTIATLGAGSSFAEGPIELPTDNFKQPTRTELFMDGQLEGKDKP